MATLLKVFVFMTLAAFQKNMEVERQIAEIEAQEREAVQLEAEEVLDAAKMRELQQALQAAEAVPAVEEDGE